MTLATPFAEAQARNQPTGKQTDAFPEQSVWIDDDNTLTLTVSDRKGETFRGKVVSGETVERIVRGTVKKGKVAWLAKGVQAARAGPGGDNTGSISGERINFESRTDTGNGTFTLHRRGASKPNPEASRDAPIAIRQLGRAPQVDFFLHIQMPDKRPERIEVVRDALQRLDQLNDGQRIQNFEATVRLFDDTKTCRSPKEARKGIESQVIFWQGADCREAEAGGGLVHGRHAARGR